VVAKLGEQGCIVCERSSGRLTRIPVLPAAVIDTTGAGDCFCGAFMAELLRCSDPVSAARAGVAAASFAVEGYGLDRLWPATPATFAQRLRAPGIGGSLQ
jgi:ribokinase